MTHADVVLLELIALELEDPARLVGDRARPPLRRVVPREQEKVLHDARGAPGFLGDDAEAVAHVRGRLGVRQQEMRLAEDRRQRIVDLVRDARGELADRFHLLGVDQLRVRALELVELAKRLGVEPRVVERQADLIRRGLDQGQLGLVEADRRSSGRARACPGSGPDCGSARTGILGSARGGRAALALGKHVRVLVVAVETDGLTGDARPGRSAPRPSGRARFTSRRRADMPRSPRSSSVLPSSDRRWRLEISWPVTRVSASTAVRRTSSTSSVRLTASATVWRILRCGSTSGRR